MIEDFELADNNTIHVVHRKHLFTIVLLILKLMLVEYEQMNVLNLSSKPTYLKG